MRNTVYDVIIIGAGVIGCAIAREVSIRHSNYKVVVLEKLGDVGLETSHLNSGVLHSGFHQNPKFLKSQLAREGSRIAVDYMVSKELSVLRCGMLIALSGQSIVGALEEIPSLVNMAKRGFNKDLKVKFLTSFGVKKLEPNLKSWGGIFIPEVAVIDSTHFVRALYCDALENGVNFRLNSCVTGIDVLTDSYLVYTDSGCVSGKVIINAAGLYADEVSDMAGIGGYKLYPWRGEYYEVVGVKRELIKRLVYPVHPSHYPGKGIHFSPRIDGRLFIGPNARFVPSKSYYSEDKTDVSVFVKQIKRFCPNISGCDLKWAYSGIRPTLSSVSGELDFIIKVDRLRPKLINLIGIDSPGLSASMAIAKHVCGLL
ncbi:MAG: NAD(P)/FAD-dependent oxidoreductase [Candidatus Yanofskybacteria bacterium]|nr:NAD(P)/FAD-dependent oxidoreductase [Candidatus Yanofskybacteria bacterium]